MEANVMPKAQGLQLEAKPQPSVNMAAELRCSLKDITSCPSAVIIKILLKRIRKWQNTQQTDNQVLSRNLHQPQSDLTPIANGNDSKIAQSLHAIFDQHDYSATKLLDDLHHIKYEHGIDGDDAKFDAAYEFFNDYTESTHCDVNQCRFIQRNYRERGHLFLSHKAVDNDTVDDEVLMDIMAMIHCYFVHSFDINRLTKKERETVEAQTSYGVTLDDEEKDDTERDGMRRTKLIADILRAKQQKLKIRRGNMRYLETEYGQSASEKMIDFATMAQVVGVDEVALGEGLSAYEKDANRLIGDLIDVLYGEDVEDMDIWKTLKVDDDRKNDIFPQILYDHFKCTQLSTGNMIKICTVTVQRMEFQIDIDVLNEVLTNNRIDGRMYDKANPETYQSVNVFAQKFKSFTDCNGQNIRRMYNVIRKWKFIKSKTKAVDEQKEEVDDGKEDEKEAVDDDTNQRPTVYEIGKQFYFWDSLKRHPNYIKAKYQNMKEEVMHSPLLDGLVSVRAWNKLTRDIAVILATEYALRITSNGLSYSMYGIQQYEPVDAEHLRSLKLYTDFDNFCAKFCAILRRENTAQVAEIANLTRTLIETVQCYGTPLTPNQTYYRGVNRSFLFKTIVTKFNLPLSTTTSVEFLKFCAFSFQFCFSE